MQTLTQTFKNATIFIKNTQANEDALVELAGIIPALRPLVENVIDMDAPLTRSGHALAKYATAFNFLRNHLDMLEPMDLPSDAPSTFTGELALVRREPTNDFLLTIPVSGNDYDRSYMLYSVLPIVMAALFNEQTDVPMFYESFPRI